MPRVSVSAPFADKRAVGSQVTVRLNGSTASIYDAAGVALANPVKVSSNGYVQFYADPGTYQLVGSGQTSTIVVDADTGAVETQAHVAATYAAKANVYLALAGSPDLLITGTITRDSNGAATSAPVTWPDGTVGTYTATTISSAFPGAVDAYVVTYGSPATKTYTQPAVTRDANGAVTTRPAVVVT